MSWVLKRNMMKIMKNKDAERFVEVCSFTFSIAFWFMGYNAVISAFSRYATIELDFTTANYPLSY